VKILNPCPKCGLVNVKLVPGHERQCRGPSANAPSSNAASSNVATALGGRIVQPPGDTAPKTGAVARTARWRAKNRERYNVKQRELMRKRRAATRTAAR
jgi:hypothetical protein